AGQWYAIFACKVTPALRSFVPQDDNASISPFTQASVLSTGPRSFVPQDDNSTSSHEGEIGIDLGITHFAALSDGTFIEYPRYYRKTEKKLARLQQSLANKKRGSHRREKARRTLARAHRKVRNQRRDFHHKAAKQREILTGR